MFLWESAFTRTTLEFHCEGSPTRSLPAQAPLESIQRCTLTVQPLRTSFSVLTPYLPSEMLDSCPRSPSGVRLSWTVHSIPPCCLSQTPQCCTGPSRSTSGLPLHFPQIIPWCSFNLPVTLLCCRTQSSSACNILSQLLRLLLIFQRLPRWLWW